MPQERKSVVNDELGERSCAEQELHKAMESQVKLVLSSCSLRFRPSPHPWTLGLVV